MYYIASKRIPEELFTVVLAAQNAKNEIRCCTCGTENSSALYVCDECISDELENTASNSCDSQCDPLHTHGVIMKDVVIQSEETTDMKVDPIRPTDGEGVPETKQANVRFEEAEADDPVLTQMVREVYKPAASMEADLGAFLTRPVNIQTFTRTIGSTLITAFAPWRLFLDHPSIQKKIDNFAFIRGDLHLRFVITSTPYIYGYDICTYRPTLGFNNAPVDSTLPTINRVSSFSQRPHVDLIPQYDKTVEMICPFIYFKEWLDLTSASDLDSMGSCTMATVVPPAVANAGVTSSYTVQVFAWMENARLSGLTVDLAVQSGKKKAFAIGEYKQDGAISKPASAIARGAGMLKDLPVIGPFATATSLVADGVAGAAALFGYTKVPDISDSKPMKNMPYRGFANSDICEPTEKVSVDSKNELTISNCCIGDMDSENLAISHLVQRNSILDTFTWQSTDAANALLWNARVNPLMCQVVAEAQQYALSPIPMNLPALCFEYWRGDIIFGFRFICSGYHAGKVRINWDPIGDVSGTADATTETLTEVIDLASATDIEIRIPYTQATAYQNCGVVPTGESFGTAPKSYNSSTDNGVLTLRVLNEQTSPLDTADITVVVYVRGAENLEFAAPVELPQALSYYHVQSAQVAKFSKAEHPVGESSEIDPNVNLVYMGEKVTSMRELLQRTNLYLCDAIYEDVASDKLGTWTWSRRPIFPGFDPNGVHSATGLVSALPEPYNFVTFTPYHLLAPCFLGERGSFSYHYDVNAFEPTVVTVGRTRRTLTTAGYPVTTTGLAGSNSAVNNISAANYRTPNGVTHTDIRTQAGLSVNLPMYSKYTFQSPNVSSRTLGSAIDDSDTDSQSGCQIVREWKNRGNDQYIMLSFFNVGPDHSLLFFINCPTLYYYLSNPVHT